MRLSCGALIICVLTIAFGQNAEEPEYESIDRCANVKCRSGEFCNQGRCECQNSCESEWTNYDRQLCVDGTTYRHECDFWRNVCYCRTGDHRCGGDEFNQHKASEGSFIKYYDECRDMSGLCNWEREGQSFAHRFSEWFRETLRRKLSDPEYDEESLLRPMSTKMRSNTNRLLTANRAPLVTYWFCELDRQNKGSLDARDLSRLYQVLLPNNPCAEVFLESCTGTSTITLEQWNRCFEIPQNETMTCSQFN